MKNVRLTQLVWITTILCVATAVTSQAQTFDYGELHGTAGWGPNEDSGSVQGLDGNLYGTLPYGGGGSGLASGTIYKLTPTGVFTTLHSFCFPYQQKCPDGQEPSSLVLGVGGNFYGTTQNGGAGEAGTIFKITPAGQLTALYSFCSKPGCQDGGGPYGGLMQGRDGSFYGTTFGGGAAARGTVFKITPAGQLTTLHNFCSQPNCMDGSGPAAGLVLGNDGNFYGTTTSGGATGGGSIFKITSNGQLTTLYSFCSINPYCQDGNFVSAPVVQGSDGNFYGTTESGGTYGDGTAFRLSPNGVLTTIHNFCGTCADGGSSSPLIPANDGNFYGVTLFSASSLGTIFQLTPNGSFTALYQFCPGQRDPCVEGAEPRSQLTQLTDGSFYGGASEGGIKRPVCSRTCGTLFRLSTGLPPFVRLNPGFGKVGQTINVLGSNLTGATSVTFNGVSASFEVFSATDIKAQVPAGATSGTIQVTTPGGTLNSNAVFQVLP